MAASDGQDETMEHAVTGTTAVGHGERREQGADVPALEVRDLRTYFDTRDGVVKAVDGLDFSVRPREVLGVVGESGCGKSVTSLSIMRLLPMPPARFASGSILYQGKDILALSEPEMRRVRGNDISMIFQDPMTSLNPVLTIGEQLLEAITLHQGLSRKAALERATDMLRLVHIPEPAQRVREYPHQLSGGMRQRVMIAMALSCNPTVLIADEPTTALDVTIQAQILSVMDEVREKFATAIIMITHDLGVVAETADRVIVMYAGKKVEEASVLDLFEDPQHPYTVGLMSSIPHIEDVDSEPERLQEIRGIVPSLDNLPPGCAFAERCNFATDQCRADYPPLEAKKPGHYAACWHSDRLAEAKR